MFKYMDKIKQLLDLVEKEEKKVNQRSNRCIDPSESAKTFGLYFLVLVMLVS